MSAPTACILHMPSVSPVALLLDSPHSGMTSPADFVPAAPRAAILSTRDAFVDELWAAVGATLVAATFPRAYVDANRAADDIDPDLLAEPWPEPLTPTAYTKRGMGLIRRRRAGSLRWLSSSVKAMNREVKTNRRSGGRAG